LARLDKTGLHGIIKETSFLPNIQSLAKVLVVGGSLAAIVVAKAPPTENIRIILSGGQGELLSLIASRIKSVATLSYPLDLKPLICILNFE
jgi:hypothetical protein